MGEDSATGRWQGRRQLVLLLAACGGSGGDGRITQAVSSPSNGWTVMSPAKLRAYRAHQVAIVGESGAGKTAVARMLLGLDPGRRAGAGAATAVDGRPTPAGQEPPGRLPEPVRLHGGLLGPGPGLDARRRAGRS